MGLEGNIEEWPSEYSHWLIDPKDNTKSFMCKEFVNISFHDLRRILGLAFKIKKNKKHQHSYSDFAKPQIYLVPLFNSFDVTVRTNLFIAYFSQPHE